MPLHTHLEQGVPDTSEEKKEGKEHATSEAEKGDIVPRQDIFRSTFPFRAFFVAQPGGTLTNPAALWSRVRDDVGIIS